MEVARTGEWVLAIDLSDALLGLITLDDSPNRGIASASVRPMEKERASRSGLGDRFQRSVRSAASVAVSSKWVV